MYLHVLPSTLFCDVRYIVFPAWPDACAPQWRNRAVDVADVAVVIVFARCVVAVVLVVGAHDVVTCLHNVSS